MLRFFWAVLSIAFFGFTPPSVHSEAPRIRVRLDAAKRWVEVSGFQLKLTDHRGRAVSGFSDLGTSRGMAQSTVRIECSKDQVRVRNLAQSSKGISLLPQSVRLESATGIVKLFNIPHRDRVVIYPATTGCEVVNEMNLEDYLEGLVNAEFSAKWSPEAVMAQIVAARSYALFQIQSQKRRARHFDVESTVKDQVYGGMLTEDAQAARWVAATRGMVLSKSIYGSKPIKAFYHSTCGGMTELPESVWGSPESGFKTRVKCEYCKSSPRYEWSLSLSRAQLQKKIQTALKSEGLPSAWSAQGPVSVFLSASLEKVETDESQGTPITPSSESFRQKDLLLTWKISGRRVTLPLSAHSFRMWMGPDQIRSTAFTLEKKRDALVFSGKGNGHGVGMCQWGAKVMGEKGGKMSEILSHYYPGVNVRKLW